MAVELERVVLPGYAHVKIEVSIAARIDITDVAVQCKMSRLLLDLVGTQLYGESPSLVAHPLSSHRRPTTALEGRHAALRPKRRKQGMDQEIVSMQADALIGEQPPLLPGGCSRWCA